MNPRITFSAGESVVTMWQSTIDALEEPAYYRFLFSIEKLRFVVQKCSYTAEGAKKLRKVGVNGYRENSLPLIKSIYKACGWDRKYSYRVDGILSPDKQAVVFCLPDGVQIISQ